MKKYVDTKKMQLDVKALILDKYIKLVKKLKRNPTEAELQLEGVTRNSVRYNYGNPKGLKLAARKKHPELFKNILDEGLFTKANFDKLTDRVQGYKRFVVTTAVTGADTHKGFLKAIKNYCKRQNALLLLIPVNDPASSAGKLSSWEVSPDLGEEQMVVGNLMLNSNIYISGIKLGAKQVDPTTGLDRLSHDSSFIYGSPKQRLKVIPNSNSKLPHVAMGTGAITLSNYESDRYLSERTAFLAEYDHKLGAIIVELDDNDMYYFRQIQADKGSGNFIDLGVCYKAEGTISKVQPEAFVLGDLHAGETDETAYKCWLDVIKQLKPKDLVIHDLFNGKSISHHTSKKIVTRAIQAQSRQNNLEQELLLCTNYLANLMDKVEGKIRIVKSNHDDFLNRYLEDGRWHLDPENLSIAAELCKAMIEGEDPVKYGIEKEVSKKLTDKLHWIKRDEDFRVAGIELGVHGDKGPSGVKGTLSNLERSYRACVVGHSHTPGILRDAWQVGTSTLLNLDYAQGASSWMHSSCLVYKNGSRQMINSIKGKWKLDNA